MLQFLPLGQYFCCIIRNIRQIKILLHTNSLKIILHNTIKIKRTKYSPKIRHFLSKPASPHVAEKPTSPAFCLLREADYFLNTKRNHTMPVQFYTSILCNPRCRRWGIYAPQCIVYWHQPSKPHKRR